MTVDLNISGPQNTGGSGVEILISIENLGGSEYGDLLIGNTGNNYFEGREGNDTITGGDGNDSINGAEGDDLISGGAGNDMLDYYDADAGITVNLALSGAQNLGGTAGIDTLSSIEQVWATAYADSVTGNESNNRLVGDAGDDTLAGGAGDDTLQGGAGADTVTGGTGIDQFLLDQLPVSASDYDVITDFVSGVDDVLINAPILLGITNVLAPFSPGILRSGSGVTTAADSDDLLIYDTATGNLYVDRDGNGSASAPVQIARLQGAPTLTVSDLVISFIGINTINGTDGNDTLTGTLGTGLDRVFGYGGNDQLQGDSGQDSLDGGTGDDTMAGGDSNDFYVVDSVGDVVTETNSDSVTGGIDLVSTTLATYTLPANVEQGRISATDAASMTGNTLDNFLTLGSGDNVVDGGDGMDTASFSAATTAVVVDLSLSGAQNTGGSGSDTLINIESLFGSSQNDTLTGNAQNNSLGGNSGDDTVFGGNGADTLIGAAGNDVLDGGDGIDTASYNTVNLAVTVSLAITGPQNTVGQGTDTFTSIENLIGSTQSDVLTGNGDANTINGVAGNDTLTGGGGADRFVFGAVITSGVDVVTDFAVGTDKIELDRAVTFTMLPAGALAAGNLRAGAGVTTAADADDFVIYDSNKGALYFDADGNGSVSAPVLFATLTGNPVLSAGDFVVSGAVVPAAISGTAGNDALSGTSGNDTIEGLAGNDTLDGNAGDDTLSGGDGLDHAQWRHRQ